MGEVGVAASGKACPRACVGLFTGTSEGDGGPKKKIRRYSSFSLSLS